jgi:hypothetical protein
MNDRDDDAIVDTGEPGGTEWDYADRKVRLHSRCERAWIEAYESGPMACRGACS